MIVFLDTSAFYAIIDADDANHEAAARTWTQLIESGNLLFTSNYIVMETCALLQNRLGVSAVRDYHNDILRAVSVEWIDKPLHDEGVASALAANRRDLSVVDCTSFVIMRQFGIDSVFTFDKHFIEQGFEYWSS